MGKMQRRKGHNFERAVAYEYCRDKYGFEDAKRNPQSRDGSAGDPDVTAWLLQMECKKQKQPNIRAAYKQALLSRKAGYYAVAVTQADRDVPLATLHLDDFLELVADARRWRERA